MSEIQMLRKYAETAELTTGMAKPYIINAGNKIGKQIQCFVDQYSNYKIDELNKHVIYFILYILQFILYIKDSAIISLNKKKKT